MKQRIHKCPACVKSTSKVHDYRIQDVKGIPMFGTYIILRIHKKRHVCKHCGKRFYESVPLLPKYQRTTNRLWMYVLKELDDTVPMKSVGRRVNLSGSTVARIVDNLSYGIYILPD